MDAALSRVTLACALRVEEKAARRGGARAARVGLGASRPLPDGRIVSFGLAGALVPRLEPGTLLTAERVVDVDGATLWEGEPLAVDGATAVVICAAGHVVDDPAARAALAERTGAVAVEMESGELAATGRLAGVVRAVADGPERRVGLLARASMPDGRTAWSCVARAFLTEPRRALRTSRDARRALRALTRAATLLAEER
jgi:nucleoside phosphorylase